MVAIGKISDWEEQQATSEKAGKRIPTDIKQRILLAITNIEYGSVEVVIHGGKVVQIECREKTRIG
jgi:hypothetical protein